MNEITKKYSDLLNMSVSEKIKETALKLISICNRMGLELSVLETVAGSDNHLIQKIKQCCATANAILTKYLDYVLANGQEPKDFSIDETKFCENYLNYLEIAVNMDVEQRYQNNKYRFPNQSKIRATAKLDYDNKSEMNLDNVLKVGVIVTYIPNNGDSSKGINVKMHPHDISSNFFRTVSIPTEQSNKDKIERSGKYRKFSNEKMLLDLMNDKMVNEKWKRGDVLDITSLLGYVDTM